MIAQLDHVDDPDVLERIATNPALHHALEMARPRNWWGTCIDPKLLFSIARDDGIPVAWVPPGGDASRTRCGAGRCSATRCVARSAGGDCGGLLEGARRVPRDPWLDDDVTLARKAIAAYRDGHHEAAMALAVSVGEPLATWASKGRVRSFDSKADRDAWEKDRKNFKKKYHWAKDELGIVGLDVSRLVFKQQVLMAPIPRFFTSRTRSSRSCSWPPFCENNRRGPKRCDRWTSRRRIEPRANRCCPMGRLQLLPGGWSHDQTGAVPRRSWETGRCGWCSTTRTNTARNWRRPARWRRSSGCTRRRSGTARPVADRAASGGLPRPRHRGGQRAPGGPSGRTWTSRSTGWRGSPPPPSPSPT